MLALFGTALAWAALTWLRQDAGAQSARPAPHRAAAPQTAAPAPAPDAIAETVVRTLPPGVTAAQWDALQAELRGRPGGAAEIQRIADYLAWSEQLRRFREGSDPAARRALALALDAGLPARLRAAEISAAEARQIKSAILEATLDDPAERAAALQRWLSANFAPVQADPRQAAFERRQAEVVAAWSAQPVPARDRAALERELDALRREAFANSPPAAR